MDKTLTEYEEAKDWKNIIIYVEKKVNVGNHNIYDLVNALWLNWNAIDSPSSLRIENDLSLKRLENNIDNCYKILKDEFSDSPDFLFFVGWISGISFWYFKGLDEKSGKEMLLGAYYKNPNNPLFKWAVRDYIKLNPDEIERLSNEIISNLSAFFDNYCLSIKKYFVESLEYERKS